MHLYGPELYDSRGSRALAVLDDALFALNTRGELVKVTAPDTPTSCDQVLVERSTPPFALEADETFTALALASPEHLLTSVESQAASYLLELEAGEVQRTEVDTAIVSIAHLAGGLFLAVDRDGGLMSYEHGTLTPLDREGSWRRVEARLGIVWLGGDNSIGRVVPGPDGAPRLETDWIDSVVGLRDELKLNALSVRCPHALDLGGSGVILEDANPDPIGVWLTGLDAEEGMQVRLRERTLERVAGFGLDGGAAVRGGELVGITRLDGASWQFPLGSATRVQSSGRISLVGGPYARLTVLVYR